MGFYNGGKTATERGRTQVDITTDAVLEGAYDPVPEPTLKAAERCVRRFAAKDDQTTILQALGLIPA